MVGVMLALVAWGVVTDRRGERFVLLAGLTATTVAGIASRADRRLVLLARHALPRRRRPRPAPTSASGRVVVGWFPPRRRGLAMGIRQMAQPVGVGVAAISIAVVADGHGVHAALLGPDHRVRRWPRVLAAVVVIDPPRPARTRPRYDGSPTPTASDSYLARIHGVSVLLVVPQFLVWTFALVWLVQDRDWSPAAAGALVAVAQVSARWAGSGPASCPTSSAAGCGPCAGSRSRPPRRWRCSA